MTGRCTRWDFDRSIGWIKFGDDMRKGHGAAIFVHFSQITEDNLGRRYLLPGDSLEFDIGFAEGDTRPTAVNVRLMNPRPEEDPAKYWEEGFVERITCHGCAAIVRRPCGGWLFLHRDNAKTRIGFAKEQVWRYRVAPPQTLYVNWQAIDAEFLGMLDE